MEEKDCKKRRIEDFDDDKEIRNKFPDFSNSASIIMDLESQLKEEKTITEQLRGDLVESDRKNGELIAFQKNIMEYVQKQMKSVESSILQKIEQRLVPNMHKKFNELKDEFSDNICSLRDDMEQQTENIGDELKQLQNNIKDTEQQSFLLHFGKKFYEFNEEMKHMKMLTTDDRVKEEGNLLLRILDLSKSELKEQGFNVLLDEMLDESMCYAFEMNGSRINVCTNPHWKTYQSKRFGAKFHERFKTFKDLENSSNRAIRLADEATELRKIIEDKSNNGVNNIGFKIIIQQIKQNIIALHGGMVLVSRFGYVEFLKEILKAGPASKLIARECRDAPLHPSHTALFEAANGGHTECVQLLLNGGPSEYRELAVDKTPLFAAASHGFVDCVRILLKDSNPKYREIPFTKGKWTPLQAAAYHGHIECVKELLNGCSPHYYKIRNNRGKNVLEIAKARGKMEIVSLLQRNQNGG